MLIEHSLIPFTGINNPIELIENEDELIEDKNDLKQKCSKSNRSQRNKTALSVAPPMNSNNKEK